VFKNEDGSVDGFLYLKIEKGPLNDIQPTFPTDIRLKIGTFKINAHGTRMGEWFVKKALDHALYENVNEVYMTIFPNHDLLIKSFGRYGFLPLAEKHTNNGTELVLIKKMGLSPEGNATANFPYINANNRKFILALHPEWHSRLLPDSILNNEDPRAIVKDISHTNSIHKIYLTKMNGTDQLRNGDILVIYRTTDGQGPAHYRSVATSICVVEDIQNIHNFPDQKSFLKYSSSYSIFSDDELKDFYSSKKYPTIIKFSYNLALVKRVTRGQMIEDLGIDAPYWGFFQLTDTQFNGILEKGKINESLIVY
jgi:hypothetical protein